MSSTQWWTTNQRGKFGTPVATFDADRDVWTVVYGPESTTISQQVMENTSNLALDVFVREFIATTDRGEKFNGVSRQNHSSRSGNSVAARFGTRIAYPCIICGLPGPSPSRACPTCLGHYLGPSAAAALPPDALNWPPSAIQQSIAEMKQQMSADMRNAVIYGTSIPPSAYLQNLKPRDDDQNAAAIMALGVYAPKHQQNLKAQQAYAQNHQALLQWIASKAYAGLHEPGTLDPPVPVSEFITGEIRAWRAWIIGENGYLRSLSHPTVWPPGEVIEGKVTSAEHGGGVYAFKDRGKLFDFCMSDYAPSGAVWGSVLLWGDVIEHDLGYRAQFCQIEQLHGEYPVVRTSLEWLRSLRSVYGLTP